MDPCENTILLLKTGVIIILACQRRCTEGDSGTDTLDTEVVTVDKNHLSC